MLDPALKDLVEKALQKVLPQVRQLRHELHRHPERTWQEQQTSDRLMKKLTAIEGLSQTSKLAKHGIVTLIEGDQPGPTIALRADMDALPIQEINQIDYKSENQGTMHACGHDGHMAGLYGTALVLSELRQHIKGRVKLIFQPAEEGGGGGEVMCDEGVLENPAVDMIFGLHGWPELPCGTVGVRSGAIMASTDEITIEVSGPGGHAAFPHLTADTVLATARIIESLQSIASRHVHPCDAVVLSITTINGGSANNVIPKDVRCQGTLRAINESTRLECHRLIKKIADAVAKANGVSVKVDIKKGYPVTVNDDEATAYVETVARDALGREAVQRLALPSMGGEDFSYYLKRCKGSFFFVGVDDGRQGGYPSLHRPDFDFNDAALPVAIKVFCHLALDGLNSK